MRETPFNYYSNSTLKMSNEFLASSANELSEEKAPLRSIRVSRTIPTQTFTKEATTEKLHFLRSFQHDNFVSVTKVFQCEDTSAIQTISEFMPVVVVDLCVRAFPFHNQFSLAAILGQVSTSFSRELLQLPTSTGSSRALFP